MSKVMLALASFIVGACTMFFALSGNHASTLAQSVTPPASFGRAEGAIPVVPPLSPGVTRHNLISGAYALDGLTTVDDQFKDVEFEYGGGAVKIVNPQFSGSIRLNLIGAAKNTMVVVKFFEDLGRGATPQAPPKKPMQVVSIDSAKTTADLITPN